MADPFSGEVFLTDGESARVRSGAEGDERLLTPRADTRPVDVNLDAPFPSAPGFRAVDLLAHPGFVESFRPRVVSTSPAPAWVAAGRRAAYVTDGGDLSGSVHFAAGIALCRAADCVLTATDPPRATGLPQATGPLKRAARAGSRSSGVRRADGRCRCTEGGPADGPVRNG